MSGDSGPDNDNDEDDHFPTIGLFHFLRMGKKSQTKIK
jgi:hypothetical protein